MSMFGLGKKAEGPTQINKVQINQSVQGFPIPVVMGRNKIQQTVFWLDGFSSKKVQQGGKGLGGGKGSSSYVYSAQVITGLCEGPILSLGDVWAGQSWLSNPSVTEMYTNSGTVPSYTPAHASLLAQDLGVHCQTPYSSSQLDLGSDAAVTLSGTDFVPLTSKNYGDPLAPGEYSVDPSTGTYYFSSADAGKVVKIVYSYVLGSVKQQEVDAIPAGKTITVGGSIPFAGNVSVLYHGGADDGKAFIQVAGTPTAGQFRLSGAAYTFGTADIGREIIITYRVNNTAAIPAGTPASLQVTMHQGYLGQTLPSVLLTNYPGSLCGYSGIAYLMHSPMDLGMGAAVQQNVWEVLTPDAYGGGVVDCCPVQCIGQVLTNPVWGLGAGALPFPPSALDDGPGGTWGAPGTIKPTGGVYQAFRVQTTGGSNVLKLYYSNGVVSVPGATYTAAVNVTNIGAKTVRVLNHSGASSPYQDVTPGTSASVTLSTEGNGVNAVQLQFLALAAGDDLDFIISGTSITTAPGQPNLITAGPGGPGWTAYLSAAIAYSLARNVGSTAWNWFVSNGFFISPVIDRQETAASAISRWLEAGMCAAFMSEGKMKLVPYGDTSTAGNGATWVAPQTFVASVSDDDFLAEEGEEPLTISTAPWQDAYNTVQVQWHNRTSQYAPEITSESDQAAINRYGSRIEDPQSWEFITTLKAATFAASMRVKRGVYTRNTYEFRLPFTFAYLEPMDVLYLDASSKWAAESNNLNLWLTGVPVRITKIVDDPKDGLKITAEDYPFGVHQPALYTKAVGQGAPPPNAFADPGNTDAVIFEAPSKFVGFMGDQICIGASGQSADWGGCNILVSEDSVNYKSVGTIRTRARLGTLATALALGTDPDSSHTFAVNLLENCPPLEAGTNLDADRGNTAAYVGGEILSTTACTVSGQNQYTFSGYTRRGRSGTTSAAHAIGDPYLRLDDAVFTYKYMPTWRTTHIYLKFQSFNSFGNSVQDEATITPVIFIIPGTNIGAIDGDTGLLVTPTAASAEPTTYPLLATSGISSTSSIIFCDPFVMQSGSLSASCLSAQVALTGKVPNTGYWIYYDDPSFAGGNVTLVATTDPNVSKSQTGRFLVGYIVTPPAKTSGGGTQTVYRPTNFTNTGDTMPSTPAAAYDGNAATPGSIYAMWVALDGPYGGSGTWGGVPAAGVAWTAGVLTITAALTVTGSTATGILKYSLDSGATWVTLASATAAKADYTVTLPAGQDLSKIQVRATCSFALSGRTARVDVYEIFVTVS